MKAVVTERDHRGRPRWRWVDVVEPSPGPDDVVIEVDAAGLNRADALMRAGAYVPSDAGWRVGHERVGFEMAGTVAAVGEAVRSALSVGDAVMAQAGGTCAERVVVDAGLVMPARGLASPVAAALPSGLLTGYDALAQAGFQPGEDVLVTGATSGVGRIAVQLARALGAASVVATARGTTRTGELRALGAELVIDTEGGRIADALAACGHPGCAVALDHVGGPVLEQVLQAAAPHARIVQIGRLGGATATFELERFAERRLRLIGTTFRHRTLAELRSLVAHVCAEPALRDRWGTIVPTLDRSYRMDDPEPAAQHLETAALAGKIVLSR